MRQLWGMSFRLSSEEERGAPIRGQKDRSAARLLAERRRRLYEDFDVPYRFILCLCRFFGASCAAPCEAAIKVGIVDTYTGPATTYTEDVLDGFKLAVSQINAKGGVLGRKMEFQTRDDKFKPDMP